MTSLQKNQSTVKTPVAWRNFLADFGRNNILLPVPSAKGKEGMAPVPFGTLAKITSTEAARIERLEGIYRNEQFIEIPASILSFYETYRPTPIYQAAELEKSVASSVGKKSLDYVTLWIKDETGNPGGSHKINTAFPQITYVKKDGKSAVVSDTGAGQWGIAVSIAAEELGLESTVFMTAQSYADKQGRVKEMERHGTLVVSSPSALTEVGSKVLKKNPRHPGSLGIGMSEAVSLVDDKTGLVLGCMSYYAALHQSVIGLELQSQLKEIGINPDVLVACVGGGSNFCGLVAPWIEHKLNGKGPVFVAAESSSIPTLSQGQYRWDFQDYGGLMPMLLMYTVGHKSIPPKHHAGGLRYHGKNPVLSILCQLGLVKVTSIPQQEALIAGLLFEEKEGIRPAPESAHAVLAGIREAIAYELIGIKKNIIVLLTGNGSFDSVAYQSVKPRH